MVTSAPALKVVRFAEFAFDCESRTLFKDGKELRIQGQPVEILGMLLECPGQVVAREDIERRLWPDGTFVEFEHSLNAAIRRLREALGDDSETPRFIETVPRRGYRFIAAVEGASHHQRRWPIAVMTAAAVIAVAGACLVYFLPRSPVLPERSQIVIADIVNSTGEPIFDGALKAALAVSLEESPFFDIVPDERIRETLKLMTRKPDEPITSAIAREVCERANAQAVLNSSIARLGGDYVVTLEALRCSDGNVLARSQQEAANKEQVLAALRLATARLRRRLGESRGSLQKFSTPLEQATTPSLEALQAFSRGVKLHTVGGRYQEEAVFFEQALKLDPNFAVARSALANTKWEQSDFEGSRQDEIAAYEMRDRASERERYMIVSSYHMRATLDLDKAIETLQAFLIAYPDDPRAHHYLGYAYLMTARFDGCIHETRQRLRLGGPTAAALNNLAYCYLALNQIDDARRTLQEAADKGFGLGGYQQLAVIAAARGDMDGAEKWLARLSATDRGQAFAIYTRALLNVSRGELRAARKGFREALQFAGSHRLQMPIIPAEWFTVEQRLGQTSEARAILREYLDTDLIALSEIGDFAQAEVLAAELAKRFPNGTIPQGRDLPLFRAMLAMHRGDPAKAIEELRPTERYELGNWTVGISAPYTRGYAYLASGDPKSAAGEFQKILDHRFLGRAPLGITTTLAQVGLARAHAAAGERDTALRDYETFLNQWKNADADIPIYQQAKAEYAKLNAQP